MPRGRGLIYLRCKPVRHSKELGQGKLRRFRGSFLDVFHCLRLAPGPAQLGARRYPASESPALCRALVTGDCKGRSVALKTGTWAKQQPSKIRSCTENSPNNKQGGEQRDRLGTAEVKITQVVHISGQARGSDCTLAALADFPKSIHRKANSA